MRVSYARLFNDDDLIKVTVPFKVLIRPRNEAVVQEYEDLEAECKIIADHSLNWNVILELSNVNLITFESFDDPICSHIFLTYMLTKTKYKTSCNKRTNSIKLKLYNVPPAKHGAKIRCILRIYGTVYEDTTTIYVQVPVKTVTISSREKLMPRGDRLFELICMTSPSRPAANIQWSILRPENEYQILLNESSEIKELDNKSGLMSTKSYLNFFTDCKESHQTIVCAALDSFSDVNPNATLDITCENYSKTSNPSMELDDIEIISLKVFNTTCSDSKNDTLSNISWLQKGLKDFGFPAGKFTYVQAIRGQTTNMCLKIDYNTTENLITDTIIQFLQNNWSMITIILLLLLSLVTVLVGCFQYRRLRQWKTLATSLNTQMQLLQEIVRQYVEINPRIYENNCRVAEINAELPYNNLLPPTENPYCNGE